jgi:dipeptidyl aminopeptidase/acylaminoacyl peptidase
MRDLNLQLAFKIIIVTLIWCSLCQAQEKRKLTPEEYKLWHTLRMGANSEDGVWTSYSKTYKNGIDTLYLKNIKTDFEYVFPAGYNEKITKKGDVFTYLQSGTLFIVYPNTGKKQHYQNVTEYEISDEGKFIVFKSASTLTILNLMSGETKQLDHVTTFKVNPTQSYMAVCMNNHFKSAIKIVNLNILEVINISDGESDKEYLEPVWNLNGNALAYYIFDRNSNIYTIGYVNLNNMQKEYTLKLGDSDKYAKNRIIIKTKLYVSDKGDKVFFDTRQLVSHSEDSLKVQVWKSSDNEYPPKEKIREIKWSVWNPINDSVLEIENDELIVVSIINHHNHAILLDNNIYLPLYEYNSLYSDVYLTDLNSGETEKILEHQLRADGSIVTESNGDYIAYFKNNHWWSYHIKTKSHRCLTEKISSAFNKYNSDRLDSQHAFGFGGWTSTGEMLVYDEYDIWLLSAEGSKIEKLTHGRENKVIHRLYTYVKSYIKDSFFRYNSDVYDLTDGLVVHTLNNETLSEGFGVWNMKTGFREIIHKDFKIHYLKRIGVKNGFLFSANGFDLPPNIVFVDNARKLKVIVVSNSQQEQFYWGKSELIHYKSPDEKNLKAALFYPANYDPDQKYPMIVSIYENKSYTLHEYVHPSITSFTGFNVTNFTQEGYFVLMPDIAYELNSPGKSALDCVNAALDKALEIGSIDENKLGLMGHSFGGFEASYIVSQTNRFKAAIASAGVNDLLSFYLDIDSSNLSNIERFESGQFRNKIPFTDLDFSAESPIMNVKSIATPLLLWTGDADKLVPPSYSIKLFSALWRLKKQCTLLIYPNEQHIIINPVNQKDITDKTLSWFNYHLNHHPKEAWIND